MRKKYLIMKEPNLKRMSIEEINEIKIDAYMSKEQTPIPSRVEWIAERVDISEHTKLLISFQIKEALLEVFESDLKDLSDCYKAHAEDNPRKEVCQVLHTLIMEKHEQIAQTKQK